MPYSFCTSQSLIASMKSDIDWRTTTRMTLRRGRDMLVRTPGPRQELKWDAKGGKLGVMTTQYAPRAKK